MVRLSGYVESRKQFKFDVEEAKRGSMAIMTGNKMNNSKVLLFGPSSSSTKPTTHEGGA